LAATLLVSLLKRSREWIDITDVAEHAGRTGGELGWHAAPHNWADGHPPCRRRPRAAAV